MSKSINIAAKNLSDRRYLPKIVGSKKGSYNRKKLKINSKKLVDNRIEFD